MRSSDVEEERLGEIGHRANANLHPLTRRDCVPLEGNAFPKCKKARIRGRAGGSRRWICDDLPLGVEVGALRLR